MVKPPSLSVQTWSALFGSAAATKATLTVLCVCVCIEEGLWLMNKTLREKEEAGKNSAPAGFQT